MGRSLGPERVEEREAGGLRPISLSGAPFHSEVLQFCFGPVLCVERDPNFQATILDQGLEVVDSLDETPGSSIDLIYSFNVLEHIEDDESMLRLWYKKLKVGGELLLYVPAFEVLYNSLDRRSGHYRRYRRRPARRMLRAVGFSVDSSRYSDSLGLVAALAFRVIDDGTGKISPRAVSLYDRYIFRLSRALDMLFHNVFGKNLLILARKPANGEDG